MLSAQTALDAALKLVCSVPAAVLTRPFLVQVCESWISLFNHGDVRMAKAAVEWLCLRANAKESSQQTKA